LKKLAIISTHPIQYNAPVFKLLAERGNIQIKVFYTWEKSKDGIFDIKFNQDIKWDIPLLEGYEFQFVKNISTNQGTHHFKGMINPTLNSEIESWKADAVLIFGWNFQSHFKAMLYFKGKIPVYFRGDSTILDEKPGIKTILRRTFLHFVYHFIDFAFYVGKNNKNYYLKHGLSEKQLIFAPHAIDIGRFDDRDGEYKKKARQWKIDLGIRNDEMVFLFAGKFEPKKNPQILVNIANKLKDLPLKFILAGDGILKDELKTLASDNPNIIFLPFQNQSTMPILYRICDVFILPSKGPGETWGLGVNEAMACGKAILISDKTGCAPDLIHPGQNGFIFKSDDINDLLEKITEFNNERCAKFGAFSVNIIQAYNYQTLLESIEKTINNYSK